MWTFNPSRKSLQNANRWAQQLSELEPLDGPVPARRLSAVSDRPFDFETAAEAAARTGAEQQKDPDGLLDMLRSRRGQRIGVDEDSDDALALLLTNGVPAAHPRPSEVPANDTGAEPEQQDEEPAETDLSDSPAAQFGQQGRRRDGRPSMLSRLSLAPQHQDADDDSLKLHDGVSTDTREITIVPSRLRPVSVAGKDTPAAPPSRPAADDAAADRPAEAPPRPAAGNVGLDELLGGGGPRRRLEGNRTQPGQGTTPRPDQDRDEPERQPSRPKRSSVPSWDEIVFGTRGD
jgi:hypothetical protein